MYLISSSMMLNRSQQWDSQMVQTRSSQEVLIMISRCGTFVRMKWWWNYKGTRKQSPACSLAQTGLTFLQILWIALWGSGICALMHPRYIIHFQYLLPSEVVLLLCLTTCVLDVVFWSSLLNTCWWCVWIYFRKQKNFWPIIIISSHLLLWLDHHLDGNRW